MQNGKSGAALGTRVNMGGGSYSYQQTIGSSLPPSVNLISNLGGKTGQDITVNN